MGSKVALGESLRCIRCGRTFKSKGSLLIHFQWQRRKGTCAIRQETTDYARSREASQHRQRIAWLENEVDRLKKEADILRSTVQQMQGI